MPHISSNITKVKRAPRSLKQTKSDRISFKTDSIVHATNRLPKKDELQTHSTRPKQNISKSTSLVRSNSNQISNVQLQFDNIQSYVSSISSQDDKHQNSWIQRYSHKNNKIADSEVIVRFQNDHSTILNKTKKRKSRNYFKKKFPLSCSLPCVLISLLIGLLLLGAIIGTVVGVSMIGSKTTIATSTTLTTTSVITTACSCLCPNELWTFNSGYLARWSFDSTLTDTNNIYNATSYNNPTFLPNGYVNQALFFNSSLLQSLSAPYLSLVNTSFTVEVWLKPTLFPNLGDHSILGLCPTAAPDQCLQLVIRKSGSNHYLYMGFFSDDCQGNTSLTLNQWIHAAFVFDITTLTQSIYLSGILDNRCTVSSAITASTGSITIGTIPAMIPIIGLNFYEGYIDHLTITRRVKSSCEILEDATLAGCFLFDGANPYVDSGPNSLLSSQSSASVISSGHSHEALSFNGTSYFQASSFTGFGIVNEPFSILLWIRPQSVSGTIVHVSTSANGQGWCVPFLGIAANGSLIAQMFNGGIVSVWGPSIPLTSAWSHVVQTWSPTNRLRLYINSTLAVSMPSVAAYGASTVSNFITLSNSLNGMGYCGGGVLGTYAPGSIKSDIDDFRVYSRELTASEISTIYYSR